MARPLVATSDQLKLCIGILLRLRSPSCREAFPLKGPQALSLREFECSHSFAISKQINNFDNSLSHYATDAWGSRAGYHQPGDTTPRIPPVQILEERTYETRWEVGAAEIDCSKGTGYSRLAAFLGTPATWRRSSEGETLIQMAIRQWALAIRIPLPQELRLILLLGHPPGQDKQRIAEAIQEAHE